MNKQGYVRLKDLEKGDHIYEYLKGNAIPMVALEDAKPVYGPLSGDHCGWECRCRRTDTETYVDLFMLNRGKAYEPVLAYRVDMPITIIALRSDDV